MRSGREALFQLQRPNLVLRWNRYRDGPALSNAPTGIHQLYSFNGSPWFTAGTGELWTAASPSAGAVRVGNPTSRTLRNVTGWNGYVWTIVPNAPDELWRSDGTIAGTQRVRVLEGTATNASPVGTDAGLLYGIASPVSHTSVTDGTDAGTHSVLATAGELFTPFKQGAFINALTAPDAGFYYSEGIVSGTVLLNAQDAFTVPAVVGDRAYESAPDFLSTDGTITGTQPNPISIKNLIAVDPVVTAVNGHVLVAQNNVGWGTFVYAYDPATGTSSPLGWSWSDGWSPSTGIGGVRQPLVIGDAGYFVAAPDAGGAQRLMRTDRTPQGTVAIASFPPSVAPVLNDVFGVTGDGHVLLGAFYNGLSVWSAAPDGGVAMLPGISAERPARGVSSNGRVFFAGGIFGTGSATYGRVVTDGTDAGTTLLTRGTNAVTSITEFNGAVYFSGPSGGLWRSDGTDAGTFDVVDIVPDAGGPMVDQLTPAGSRLFFSARIGSSGETLFVTDGTPAGTSWVAPNLTNPQRLSAWGNRVLFLASDGQAQKLWQSDGTQSGTTLVTDVPTGFGSSPGGIFVGRMGRLSFPPEIRTATSCGRAPAIQPRPARCWT